MDRERVELVYNGCVLHKKRTWSEIEALDEAVRRTGGRVALQGNLDPVTLYASPDAIRAEVGRALDSYRDGNGGSRDGHIFNLGHGITPETIRKSIGDIIAHVASKDQVTVEIDDGPAHMVGHNLRGYIEELEKKMRAAAADLEFELAGRLRDEIRQLEASELGLPEGDRKAPIVGRSNEGKPGTRKTRYGKTRYKKMGGKP